MINRLCILSVILCCLLANSVLMASERPKALMILKKNETFLKVAKTIEDEMKNKIDIETFINSSDISQSEFESKINSAHPGLVIAFDNSQLKYVLSYNETHPKKMLPAVVLMGLNLKNLLANNPNVCGIAYEVPAYTLITQFRYLVERPIQDVLVFYRPSVFGQMIEETKSKLAMEKIAMTTVNVEARGKEKEKILQFLKGDGLAFIQNDKSYDAIWVMLDSSLLEPQLFAEFWLPLGQKKKTPILVGVENLVNPNFDFGVFAITPNLQDMAMQAVQIIESILIDHESPKNIGIENLIGVNKFLNMKKAKKIELNIIKERSSEVQVLE